MEQSSTAKLRGYLAGDTDKIIDLLASAMPVDAPTRAWFAEYVLLDANFDPNGLLLAEVDGALVGVVFAVRGRGVAGIPVEADGGWIPLFAVHPGYRRRGIGAELIKAATDFLVTAGCAWVRVAGYPPSYFLPGIDPVIYPAAIALLESAGFKITSSPVAMDAPLATYQTPADVGKLREQREHEGYTFAAATFDDLPEVIKACDSDLAPDWGEALRESVIRHGRADRVLVARDSSGAVVGFATYGAYRGLLERFGPFGVLGDQRGTGLGKILLHATLTAMRSEGAHSAWFLWTGEDSPAGRLYRSAGFATTRTFKVMQLSGSRTNRQSEGER